MSALKTLLIPGTVATLSLISERLLAQVQLHPSSVAPAGWERFALRVVNQTDTPIVGARVMVPDLIAVLGVDAPPGWTFQFIAGTDSTPKAIEWSQGVLEREEFREFAFLGRLAGDARRRELVFPVTLTRADGSVTEWTRARGGGAPPIVNIVGAASITVWGSVGLAGAAVGIAILALALAVANRKTAADKQRTGI